MQRLLPHGFHWRSPCSPTPPHEVSKTQPPPGTRHPELDSSYKALRQRSVYPSSEATHLPTLRAASPIARLHVCSSARDARPCYHMSYRGSNQPLESSIYAMLYASLGSPDHACFVAAATIRSSARRSWLPQHGWPAPAPPQPRNPEHDFRALVLQPPHYEPLPSHYSVITITSARPPNCQA